jgi:hypothetical protein
MTHNRQIYCICIQNTNQNTREPWYQGAKGSTDGARTGPVYYYYTLLVLVHSSIVEVEDRHSTLCLFIVPYIMYNVVLLVCASMPCVLSCLWYLSLLPKAQIQKM